MNLKQLIRFVLSKGGSSPAQISFKYKLVAFCEPGGSKTFVRVTSGSSTTGAYAAGYADSGDGLLLNNNTIDGANKYPIPLKGAAKISFDVPENVKATVFFVDSKTASSSSATLAAWVGGDNSAYDSTVENGPREVTVPEGADSFAFSLYWKNNTITDEIMASVKITATK